MRRSIAIGLAGAAVLATTTAVTTTAGEAAQIRQPPAPVPPAVAAARFGPCPQDIAKQDPQTQCANVDVPLDYRNPTGEKISLLVSKVPARNPAQRKGSLLVNPGGPGGEGAGFAGELAGKLPAQVRDSYDVVGWDTRNTEHSEPITCADPNTFWKNPLPDPDDPAARDTHWQRAQQYADGCQQRAGKFLPHLTTVNNARDIDQVRQALRQPKISYLGYSYGTYLGANYGQLFPQHVDRMILDSSVDPDPAHVWYPDNLNQDVAAQQRLGDFFDWAARYDQVFHLGTTRDQVRAAWEGVQADLRRHPHGPLGPWEFTDMTFQGLYGESTWTPLAKGIDAFRNRHDDRALIGQVQTKDRPAETSNAIYNAVECADAPWPTDRRRWEHDSAQVAKRSPFAAWFNSWGVAPCAKWHAPHHRPLKITGAGLPPVLMFNSVRDVATPYRGAQQMHRSLPSSTLVTENDAGKHGVYALAGNPQADRIGTDYLLSGSVPHGDISIPGHPLPDPTKQPAR